MVDIDRRGEHAGQHSWQIIIDLGRDANGKKRRKFITVKGTKTEAQRQLREKLSSLDNGLPMDNGKLSVGDLLDRWVRDYATPNVRPKMLQRYEGDVRIHIKPAIGHVALEKLSPAAVQAMEANLLASGKSPRSVQHTHVVLKMALKKGIQWGLVYRNVADAVDAPKVRRKEIDPPPAEKLGDILDLARKTPHLVVHYFLAYTGCRRSEALGLRWTDVDLEHGTASIVQTLQRLPKGQGLAFLPTKSAKSRRAIKLDAGTVAMLREHRGTQLLAKADLGATYKDNGLVFPNEFGEPLSPSIVSRTFKKLVGEAGTPRTRLHDLRHAHATEMLKAGVHLKVVQERLGHSTIAITSDFYTHVAPTLQEEAADAFAEAMRRARDARGMGNGG